MSALITYRGVRIVSPTPSENGGIALNENFVFLADNAQTSSDHIAATSSVHGATSSNTANRIVARDGSGGFSAGIITATGFVGPLTGNASTATTSADAQAHIARTDNPHSTTAAQVGTYTTTAIDTLLAAKSDRSGVVALVDGPTISANAAAGNTFEVTLAGNRTISNPTNSANGQKIVYRLTQDATGNRTVTWGSAFRFAGGTPPTLSSAPGKTDYLGFAYTATAAKWDCLAVRLGF